MTEERSLDVLKHQYPMAFVKATPMEEGLLLEGEAREFYLLRKYKGGTGELMAALEAEEYLRHNGFAWALPHLPMKGGKAVLEEGEQIFYLKHWQPKEPEVPLRWYFQLGSESLARVHKAGEGFHPVGVEGWEWPDWIKLFEMARDAVYEMHTSIIRDKETKVAKYFDRTAHDAIRSIEEAIVHLKEAGYIEQRMEGMRKGYINLNRVPTPMPGLQFDLVGKLTPDLPACGLASFVGQQGDWSQSRMINDVVDVLEAYNRVRRLKSEEIDLIKGFFKFPWQFWWATEEYFLKEDDKKHKAYAKALKTVFKGYNQEVRTALQEF